MPQYAEAVSEQNLSIEVVTEQSPRLTPEASASTLLIAKRQAILDHIASERETKPKVKLDWRELLADAEVTLDEAQHKLATRALEQVGVRAQQREATHASLFLEWFAADGKSVVEVAAGRPRIAQKMYKVVREVTPEVIDPALEPNYSIDPAIIWELSNPTTQIPPHIYEATQFAYGSSVTDDQFSKPVRLGMPQLRNQPEVDDSNPLAWQADALCAQTDPEAFFPEKGGSIREAKRVCTSCEVKSQCLHYALDNGERFGIWGGLSERERRRLRRPRSI